MKEKKEKMNTLTKILLTLGITTLIFMIVMTVIFCIYGATPDTLISSYFTCVFSEAGFCAAIQAFKIIKKKEKTEEKSEEKNEETPEIDLTFNESETFASLIEEITKNNSEDEACG